MAAFIIYIIRWAVSLTLLYSLFGLFLKRETLHGMNRVVLLFVLVASMMLPWCQVTINKSNIITENRGIIEQQLKHVQNPVFDFPERVVYHNEHSNVSYNTPPVHENMHLVVPLMIVIYLTGLMMAWGRYFWQLAALLLLIRRSKRTDVEGLPKGVHVLVHPEIKTPCSWMCWMLLNPSDTSVCPIIKHELSHIRLGHSWDMLLCELTCRMLWFLPFAWMLRQDLRDVHEYQADRSVLSAGINDEEYQLLLIKKATSTGLQPVVNAFNQSPIKRRFKMMYRKPSRRWVVLKAAYLLPLCALALVAFARPQAISEIEEKVEETAPTVVDAIKTVAQQLPSLQEERQGVGSVTTLASDPEVTNPTPTGTGSSCAEQPDSNLVKADLTESGDFAIVNKKTAVELLDSTMQAVGARKIAEGSYIGHFQPNLNNDTVRIARATIVDRQSQQIDEHLYAQNSADPYAYNITLNAETRKDRKGYYIRFLQPVNSTVRNYDKSEVDPMMLSTDSVLTKRSSRSIYTFKPVAIERNKKDTRVYMYTGFKGEPQLEIWRQLNTNHYSYLAIVDELTGDKYMCRATDYDYFKYVRDEHIGKDTVKLYQVCLVFPPLDKRVKDAYFGTIEEDGRYSNTFDLNDIPRKGRVITK